MYRHWLQLTRQLHRSEAGITGVETAIILIAFVVGASLFAFAVLSAGTDSTERGKEAVLAGLSEVQSTAELRGELVALSNTIGPTATVGSLAFTLANVIGGEPLDLTDTSNGDNRVIIDYRDDGQWHTNLDWRVHWLSGDGDNLLERYELAQITVADLDSQLTNPLEVNTFFVLEIKPPQGATLVLARRTPPYLEQAMQLH